jgi:hypothetical protein
MAVVYAVDPVNTLALFAFADTAVVIVLTLVNVVTYISCCQRVISAVLVCCLLQQ